MDFKDRLLALMKHYGHNKNSLSHAVGASNNTIVGRLVNEPDRRPSFEVLSLILKAFPSINPSWLILGVGNMFIQTGNNIKSSSDRIARLCEVLHITHPQLSEATGIELSNLKAILNGDREPSDAQLGAICAAYPVINQDWIMKGEGDMLVMGLSTKDFVPYFDSLPAGMTEDLAMHMPGMFTIYSTRLSAEPLGVRFGVRMQSTDFAPVILAGDYLTVACVPYNDLLPSDIVFISTAKRNMVRRISRQIMNDDMVYVSDGSGTEHTVPIEDITLIGLVRSIIRTIG